MMDEHFFRAMSTGLAHVDLCLVRQLSQGCSLLKAFSLIPFDPDPQQELSPAHFCEQLGSRVTLCEDDEQG